MDSVFSEPKAFSSALSLAHTWKGAAYGLASQVNYELAGRSCDLALFFVSEPYENFDPAALSRLFSELLSCRTLIGCNACGVIGRGHEVEMQPAMSLLAMHLPGVKLNSFHITSDQTASLERSEELVRMLDIYPTDRPVFLCFANPINSYVNKLLGLFSDGYPDRPVIGGLASAVFMGRSNWLALDGQCPSGGAVCVALSGDIQVDTMVSQGCRPIDKTFIVTKADKNILFELGGRPALEVLKGVFESLAFKDLRLAQESVYIGLAMEESQTSFGRGDFLVRDIVTCDPDTGALLVGAVLKTGQTIRFHVKDAEWADRDLKTLLNAAPQRPQARGLLLVDSCGRGRGLYGAADHDVTLVQSSSGPAPLAGFFSSGEFSLAGRRNHVHGYTSSLTVIR